jgi:hypothetical protein
LVVEHHDTTRRLAPLDDLILSDEVVDWQQGNEREPKQRRRGRPA